MRTASAQNYLTDSLSRLEVKTKKLKKYPLLISYPSISRAAGCKMCRGFSGRNLFFGMRLQNRCNTHVLCAQQTPMPSGCFLEKHTAGDEEVEERKQTNKQTNKNGHLVLQLLLCLFVLLRFQYRDAHRITACCASSLCPPPVLPST